jgi:hypothetical protein
MGGFEIDNNIDQRYTIHSNLEPDIYQSWLYGVDVGRQLNSGLLKDE